MLLITSPGWLLLGWLVRKFIDHRQQPRQMMDCVMESDEELGYWVERLPVIPAAITSPDEFLNWIGQH